MPTAPRVRRQIVRAAALLLPALAALVLPAPAARAQTVLGLAIGAPESALGGLGVAAADSIVTPAMAIRGYNLPDGARFEVVVDRQKDAIVFLQHSRLGTTETTAGDLPGTTYGRTTLAELRARGGSNGFAFRGGPGPSVVGDRFVLTNAYDVSGQPLVVLFLSALPAADVEKLKAAGEQGAAALGDRAVMAGTILARRAYLETVWGSERIADDPCPPLVWGARP